MTKQLRKLRDDPVPLVRYERKGWQVTVEGWRVLEREPVTARYAFRPRVLPAREKRARKGAVRKVAFEVFEGRGGDELPIVD